MKKAASATIITRGQYLAFQRRDEHAPKDKNKLSLFGGANEGEELPSEGAERELREETSLSFESDDLTFLCTYYREDLDKMQHLYVLHTDETSFDVYEGKGVEWYTMEEILGHSDISVGLRESLMKYKEISQDS